MDRGETTDASLLWIVSELYYPEDTSTGYFLTAIAESLAVRRRVRVICGQPTYSSRGRRAPKQEVRNRVPIERCWGATLNKDVLALRLVNLVTISCSIFLRLVWRLRANQRVLVVTNPPLLPFVAALACRLRGAKCLLLVHDVYPEVAVAAGLLGAGGVAARLLHRCVRRLYAQAQRIVVLGRDMQALVCRKLASDHERVAIIPNWGDVETIRPEPRNCNRLLTTLGLSQRFVVQYSGNMGRSHDIEGIVKAAELLKSQPEVHFLMSGSGAKRSWLERSIAGFKLKNITLLKHCDRAELSELLNACDVAVIAFVPGMCGVSVPSRMYNVMAAGKPIIAIAENESELALVVREEQIGWVVPPNDPNALADAVRQAQSQPQILAEMGRRARRAAEAKYSLQSVVRSYESLLASMDLDSADLHDGTKRRAA